MKRIYLSIVFLIAYAAVYSQSTSWTGIADSTWHNSSNWTAGVPNDTLDAIIGDSYYTGSYDPAVLSAARCRALTLNAGTTLNVYTSDTIIVNGNLTNDGLIQGDSTSFAFDGSNVVLCGTGTAVYKNVRVLPGVNFTINKNISISGDLLVEGSLNAVGRTITFVGSDPSVIGGSGSIILGDLLQNKSGSFTKLETSVMIKGKLNLTSGVIYTDASALLTLADNAVSSSGSSSSYVDGPMQKIGDEAFIFPLGNNGVWARLGISSPGLVGDAFIAQYHAYPYSNTDSISPCSPVMFNVSKIEYWTCDRSAGTDNVSVSLYWEDNIRSDISDYSGLTVAHWNGSRWDNAGNNGIVPLAQGSVTSSVQSTFGPFTFGSVSNDNPMPIGLVDFSVKMEENSYAKLEWQTATETNNKYFIVEKSADGVVFEALATLPGAGSSLINHSYNYSDTEPFEGATFYRVKQVDYNGNHSYSFVRMVEWYENREDIELFPNPCNGKTFSVDLVKDSKVSMILVYNSSGQKVLEVPVAGQEMRMHIDAGAGLAPGVYSMVAIGEGVHYVKKLVVE